MISRFFLILLTALLNIPTLSWATAYTSGGAGDWSTPSTWSPEGVPTDGDTVTLAHAITVSSAVTIGTSPSDQTTMVVSISSGGRLIISDGYSLTVKGNLYNGAGASGAVQNGIQLGAGSHLYFEGSQAYVLKGGAYARIYARGTSAAHATIESTSTGKAKFTQELFEKGNCFDAQWLDFISLGDASNAAILSSSNGGNYPTSTSLTDCTIQGCGATTFGAAAATGSVVWQRVTVSGSLNTGSLAAYFLGYVGSTSSVTDSVINTEATFSPPAGFSVTNTYFGKRVGTAAVTAINKGFVSFTNNVIRFHAAGARDFDSNAQNSLLFDDSGYSNPSMLNLAAVAENRSITGCVIDSDGTAISGDILLPKSSAGFETTIANNIFLPQAAGLAMGKFVSTVYELAGSTTRIDNNTFYVGANNTTTPETGTGVGESGTGHAGDIASFKNNLIWSLPGVTGGYKFVRQQSAGQDFVSATNANYNWGLNLDAGSEGNGYHCWTGYQATPLFSAGTPDANGGSADPGFVDAARNTAIYDISGLGNPAGPGWASGTVYVVGDIVSSSTSTFYGGTTINFRCISDHTSASGHATNGQPTASTTTSWRTNWELASLYRLREDRTRIQALVSWIRAGFAPTNTLLNGTGSGGVDIGAVDVLLGWSQKILGITNPSKIMGISIGEITRVNGI